jgi:hypothetical protein
METKTVNTPEACFGWRERKLSEELMAWAMGKAWQKRVSVKRLTNDELEALERACVKIGNFNLWRRCQHEMLDRPDFIPERGTLLEVDLIESLPGDQFYFEREPFCGPYLYDYLTYKEQRNPATVAHLERQRKRDELLGGLSSLEYFKVHGELPWPDLPRPAEVRLSEL